MKNLAKKSVQIKPLRSQAFFQGYSLQSSNLNNYKHQFFSGPQYFSYGCKIMKRFRTNDIVPIEILLGGLFETDCIHSPLVHVTSAKPNHPIPGYQWSVG